jgi:drug/metabolite transporter (DMT)-like permease
MAPTRRDKTLTYYLLEWLPCFVYVVLYVVLDLLIASEGFTDDITGKRKFHYTPGVLILLAEAGKWVLTLTFLIIERCSRPSAQRYRYAPLEEEEIASTEPPKPEVDLELDWSQGVYYAVPAALYTLWNYLNYQSLLHVSLSVYSIIYQSVLFFSAFLWSVTFDRKLSVVQWMALVLLAAGVFVVHLRDGFAFVVDLAVLWVLAQAMVSAIASVYNEFLYKRPRKAVSINVQNLYLYTFSTIFTAAYLVASEDVEIFKPENFFRGFSPIVVIIIVTTVMLGISVSLVLKHRDLVVKLYAQAIHSPIEVVCAHFVLNTELTPLIGLASALIAVSTYMYYRPESQYNYAKSRDQARIVKIEAKARAEDDAFESDPFAPAVPPNAADVPVDESINQRPPAQTSIWQQTQKDAAKLAL